MYEAVATLRSTTYTQDSALNQVPVYTDREVFVKPRSVSRSDFYQAAQSGLKPSIVLVISTAEDYQGEKSDYGHGQPCRRPPRRARNHFYVVCRPQYQLQSARLRQNDAFAPAVRLDDGENDYLDQGTWLQPWNDAGRGRGKEDHAS